MPAIDEGRGRRSQKRKPRELPAHVDDGLFLCANAIELAHPASGEWLRVSAREPHNFATFCAAGAQ